MLAIRAAGWSAVLCCVLAAATVRSEPLVLCGMDEVFVIDSSTPADGNVAKLWSWRARDCESLPESLRGRFGTTDECKPTADGKHVLTASSGGGCALVERATGRALWHAVVPNAHSLELLPGGRIVVAASVSKQGNRLMLFDVKRPDVLVAEAPLPSAHGVVWDDARDRLWALGYDELHAYERRDWDSPQPQLALVEKFRLPDVGGHDLQAVPHGRRPYRQHARRRPPVRPPHVKVPPAPATGRSDEREEYPSPPTHRPDGLRPKQQHRLVDPRDPLPLAQRNAAATERKTLQGALAALTRDGSREAAQVVSPRREPRVSGTTEIRKPQAERPDPVDLGPYALNAEQPADTDRDDQ